MADQPRIVGGYVPAEADTGLAVPPPGGAATPAAAQPIVRAARRRRRQEPTSRELLEEVARAAEQPGPPRGTALAGATIEEAIGRATLAAEVERRRHHRVHTAQPGL